MNTDKYLAVAYYDFSKNNENTDVNTYTDLLIVDVDLYSIGFCKHDNKGAVEKYVNIVYQMQVSALRI